MMEEDKIVEADCSHSSTATTQLTAGGGSPDVIAVGADDSTNGRCSGAMGAAMAEDRVKGPWSPEEDAVLSSLVGKWGARNWSLIAQGILGRLGKLCRLWWCNQLAPNVKRKPFTGNFFFFLKLGHSVVPFHLLALKIRYSV